LNQKILLVEDDVRLAQMIETYLRQSGFAVSHASTGMAALEAARSDAFAAIILDLMLPDMDGRDGQGHRARDGRRRLPRETLRAA
jgi:two-component system response regulator ResD